MKPVLMGLSIRLWDNIVIFYLLCSCVGLMFILKYGTILNKPRTQLQKINILKELFSCSLCLGFWSGVVIAYSAQGLIPGLIFLPLASAAICWVVDLIVDLLSIIANLLD